MTKDKELTMVVAVDDYAFNLAQEKGIYACPASYSGRDRGDYIAFYRTSPVQEITNYAEIKEITEGETDKLSSADKLQMFPKLSQESRVFELGDIRELKTHIKKGDSTAVQGTWYKDLQEIKKAKELSDLTKN